MYVHLNLLGVGYSGITINKESKKDKTTLNRTLNSSWGSSWDKELYDNIRIRGNIQKISNKKELLQ